MGMGELEKRFSYPAELSRDGKRWAVQFRDIPRATAAADTREQSLRQAKEALQAALQAYIDSGSQLPWPSAARRGEEIVTVSLQSQLKLGLYESYRKMGITKTELGRRIEPPVHKANVDRFFSLKHASRLDALEAVATAMGKRMAIVLRNVAALVLMCGPMCGELSQTIERPCAEVWRAGVETFRKVGLNPRQLDREGGTALLRPVGGAITGSADVRDWTRKYATRAASLSERLSVEATVTFSPRNGGAACRVWVAVDMIGHNGQAQTEFLSNGSLERQILLGIHSALE